MNLIVQTILMLLSVTFLSAQSSYNQPEELVAVGINGAKVVPGTYRVSPDQRVLDVIKMANGGVLPALDTIDSRNIIVESEGGLLDTFDLLRYIAIGDLSQNPYVQGGQSIHINFATKWVFISGDLQGALVGEVPLKKGETIGEFLSLYTFNATADTTRLLCERQGQHSIELSLEQLDTVILRDLDNITLFPLKEQKDVFRVTITGEVLRPGVYTIKHGETMAYDLIKKSGGASSLGNIDEAWLIRLGKKDRLPQQELTEGMESVQKEITNSISNTIISGDYMIIPLKTGDIALEDGDEIVIPKREKIVYVSGLVKQPGGYPYEEGKDTRYYIKKAGGLARSANRKEIRIVQSYGNVYRTVDQEIVASGDLILVPERDKEARTRLVLAIITSVATTLTAIVTFSAFVQNQ